MQYYNNRHIYYKRSPSHPFRKLFFMLFSLSIIGLMYFIYTLFIPPQTTLISPQITQAFEHTPQSAPRPTADIIQPKKYSSLEHAVQTALEGTNGRYAIYIKNLKTSEGYTLNATEEFDTGSLYKLWVMAKVYDLVEEGKLNPDQVLSSTIKDLNQKFSISEDVAEQTEGSISLTITQALNQMITISHNYAALLLTEKIRLSSVAVYIKELDLTNSSVGTSKDLPQTTAEDMAKFYQKLYHNQVINPEYSQKMLDILKKQQLNHKIPKYLPQNIPIAHKTGELGQATHDAGIVYTLKGDYIIVVLSDSAIPKAAEDRIADISKAVYDYFNY